MLIIKLPVGCMRNHDGSKRDEIGYAICDNTSYDGGDHFLTHGILPGASSRARTELVKEK